MQIDTSKPRPAGVYDGLLGGKDNYPVDQRVGETLPEQSRAILSEEAFVHLPWAKLLPYGNGKLVLRS
ncbi:SAM-dependent methyltransferase [Streptomyces griseoluteus]